MCDLGNSDLEIDSLSKLTELRKITLFGSCETTGKIGNLLENWPKATEIALRFGSNISDGDIGQLASGDKLRCLDLVGNQLTVSGITQLKKQCPNLQSFCIEKPQNMSVSDQTLFVAEILKQPSSIVSLKLLQFENCILQTLSIEDPIKNPPELREITTLVLSQVLRHRQVCEILNAFPKMTHFTSYFYQSFGPGIGTEQSSDEIFEKYPKMKVLNFHSRKFTRNH